MSSGATTPAPSAPPPPPKAPPILVQEAPKLSTKSELDEGALELNRRQKGTGRYKIQKIKKAKGNSGAGMGAV